MRCDILYIIFNVKSELPNDIIKIIILWKMFMISSKSNKTINIYCNVIRQSQISMSLQKKVYN